MATATVIQHAEIYEDIKDILVAMANQALYNVLVCGETSHEVWYTEVLNGETLHLSATEYTNGQATRFHLQHGDFEVWSFFSDVIVDFLYEAVTGDMVEYITEEQPVQLDMFDVLAV